MKVDQFEVTAAGIVRQTAVQSQDFATGVPQSALDCAQPQHSGLPLAAGLAAVDFAADLGGQGLRPSLEAAVVIVYCLHLLF